VLVILFVPLFFVLVLGAFKVRRLPTTLAVQEQ